MLISDIEITLRGGVLGIITKHRKGKIIFLSLVLWWLTHEMELYFAR